MSGVLDGCAPCPSTLTTEMRLNLFLKIGLMLATCHILKFMDLMPTAVSYNADFVGST